MRAKTRQAMKNHPEPLCAQTTIVAETETRSVKLRLLKYYVKTGEGFECTA
jgi:hypothetical protein